MAYRFQLATLSSSESPPPSEPRLDKETEGRLLEEKVVKLVLSLPESSFLRNYVMYGSELTDANAAYHVLGGLALLTQTIPDAMYMRLGGKLHGNLYMLAVGRTTDSRKTASVALAREVLKEAIPGAAGEHPGSYEGLTDSLAARPRQLLLYEEFGAFLAQSARGYLTPIKQVYTEVYDGAPAGKKLSANRKRTAPPVDNPRLSIFGGVTPDDLSRHSEPTDWTNGFFARFLVIAARRVRKILFPPEWPEMKLWLAGRLAEYNSNGTVAPCVGYEPEASDMWAAFDQHQEKVAREAPRRIAGAIGRAPGMVQKIAMLLAWDIGEARQQGEPWKIAAHHLGPAIEIINMHIASVLSLNEELAGTADMFQRLSVLRAVEDAEGRPLDVGQIAYRAQLLVKRAREIIDTLMEQREIERVSVPMGSTMVDAYRSTKHAVTEEAAKVIPIHRAPPPPPLPPTQTTTKPEEV